MKAASPIRVIFMLILTLGFLNQHSGNICGSILAGQEQSTQPIPSGNFSSHNSIDLEHSDDILSDPQDLTCSPDFIPFNAILMAVPAPVFAAPSPCWQPPDLLS